MAVVAAVAVLAAVGADGAPQTADVPGHPSAARSAAAFIRAGDMAMATGDKTSAIAFYRRAAGLTPKDPVPVVRLAEALAKSGARAAALEAYVQAQARDPKSAAIDLAMGRLALQLDQPQDALADFEGAGRLSQSTAAWNGMGVAQDALGDHAQAQADYLKGLALKPGDRSLRNNLGLSQALAGHYPDAIATFSALLDEPGSVPGERLNLALVYGLQGDDDKAAHTAREVLGEADNAANRQYYTVLRAMDDRTRTRAIMGLGPGRGPASKAAPTADPKLQ
jgi:Flp pilus assembly protein TadD